MTAKRRKRRRPLRFLSVCSGIDVASLALTPLGFECVGFAETDPQACAVLKHHWPETKNFGDMENFREWRPAAFDVLIGGTPCQSFSVAGLRAGLADPRGNLALVYLAMADRFRPEWLIWENVPGAYSATSHAAPDQRPPEQYVGVVEGEERVVFDEYDADEAHAFACFLAGLQELGYGFAYRTLDAQYFGVPQRRRRIILVANLRAWQRAAAVLFERESLLRNPPPSRAPRENVAGTLGARTAGGGRSDDLDGHGAYIPEVADPIVTKEGETYTHEGSGNFRLRNVVAPTVTGGRSGGTSHGKHSGSDRMPMVAVAPELAVTLTVGGHPNSNRPGRHKEDDDNLVAEVAGTVSAKWSKGTGGPAGDECQNLIACFDETQVTHRENRSTCDPDTAGLSRTARPPAVAFKAGAGARAHGIGEGDVAPTLGGTHSGNNQVPAVAFNHGRGLGPHGSLEATETVPALSASEGKSHTAVAFKASHYTRGKDGAPSEVCPPLAADADKGDQDPVVAVSLRGRDGGNMPELEPGEVAPALRTGEGGSGNPMVLETLVRRLTPVECERLMGVPDDYTRVKYGRAYLSDTARYRLIGNAFVRHVVEFVGRRIKLLHEALPED